MGRGNSPFWYEYVQSGRRNVENGKDSPLHDFLVKRDDYYVR
jgi:hypothetical protein